MTPAEPFLQKDKPVYSLRNLLVIVSGQSSGNGNDSAPGFVRGLFIFACGYFGVFAGRCSNGYFQSECRAS